MEWYKATLTVATKKKGMSDFTALIEQHLHTFGHTGRDVFSVYSAYERILGHLGEL